MPAAPASFAVAREKVGAALQGMTDADAAIGKDPAGFRGKIDGPAAQEHPYSTAAVFAAANAAAKSPDVKQAEKALAELESLGRSAGELQADLRRRQASLQGHRTWLANRREAADTLAAADQALRDETSVAKAEACLKLLADLRRRLPKVADEGREPIDALTAAEAEKADSLRNWAEYRRAFLQAKAKHPASAKVPAKTLPGLIAEWDRFLGVHGRPGAPDPDECVAEARRLRADARLQFLWEKAAVQQTAASLAPAVVAWLDEPRHEGHDEPDRAAAAAAIVRQWLEKNLPAAPTPPRGLDGMSEGIVDHKDQGKTRLIAIFEAVPDAPGRYRWWESADKRPDTPLGQGTVLLKAAPAPPKYKGWAERFKKIRDEYVSAGGRGDADSFVEQCRALRDDFANHTKLPPFDPNSRFDKEAADWDEKVFEQAARVAAECDTALGESGLRERLAEGGGARR
jgi:hypothetical protein